jgi:hypothetical protein
MIAKLLLSLLIIVGVGASAFTATKALLSDQATLTANTFSTGTVSLLVDNDITGADFDESKTGFSQTLFPGQTVTNYLRLQNDGSGVALSIQAQATSVGGTINPDDVTVTLTAVDGTNAPVGSPVSKTLTQWETIGGLGNTNVPSDGIQRYKMDVSLDSGVTASGASVNFNFVFTGTQVLE